MLAFRKFLLLTGMICVIAASHGCGKDSGDTIPLIADHSVARLSVLDSIPGSAISAAKGHLHIAYGHTSHGSQLVDGINGLTAFMNGRGRTANLYGGLDLRDYYGNFGGLGTAQDLGNPDRTTWEAATRTYLNAHPEINVIIWSWCGQVSSATEANITTYLSLMSGLERDYPNVRFVYMTGHLDGTGTSGNLHLRNEQIRAFCRDNEKALFDFADIETYNPDGTYFGDRHPADSCAYDGGNWATEWQSVHAEGSEWYSCSSAHSEAVNANMKAYALWWLLSRLAGWDG